MKEIKPTKIYEEGGIRITYSEEHPHGLIEILNEETREYVKYDPVGASERILEAQSDFLN